MFLSPTNQTTAVLVAGLAYHTTIGNIVSERSAHDIMRMAGVPAVLIAAHQVRWNVVLLLGVEEYMETLSLKADSSVKRRQHVYPRLLLYSTSAWAVLLREIYERARDSIASQRLSLPSTSIQQEGLG